MLPGCAGWLCGLIYLAMLAGYVGMQPGYAGCLSSLFYLVLLDILGGNAAYDF
jgi:hypothetical protein